MLMNMPDSQWGLYASGNQRLFKHMENPFTRIEFEPKIIPQEYTISQMIERLVYNPNIYDAIIVFCCYGCWFGRWCGWFVCLTGDDVSRYSCWFRIVL